MAECIQENIISVIVPVYNGERYIKQCIDSIFSSSYINNLEVIIVDDGSTDNTPSIISDIELNDSNLQNRGGVK